MAHWKDSWKTLYQTDREWLRAKKDGSEDPVLEIAEEVGEYEDEEGFEQHKYLLFRFDVSRLKLVNDPVNAGITYLVPAGYDKSWPHPLASYEEWFASDLEEVARSIGADPLELAKSFTSTDPKVRAGAYVAVGGYHGYANFDTEPLEINEPALNKRWA